MSKIHPKNGQDQKSDVCDNLQGIDIRLLTFTDICEKALQNVTSDPSPKANKECFSAILPICRITPTLINIAPPTLLCLRFFYYCSRD